MDYDTKAMQNKLLNIIEGRICGYSFEQIAERVDMSPYAIKSLLDKFLNKQRGDRISNCPYLSLWLFYNETSEKKFSDLTAVNLNNLHGVLNGKKDFTAKEMRIIHEHTKLSYNELMAKNVASVSLRLGI